VEIDSVAMQANELGGRVRRALSAHTGVPTIPQVFVGGQFVGGCTDVFDAYGAGELQARLAAAGVALKGRGSIDPYDMLPKWLAKREPA
jgi:cysteine synthase A